MEDQTVHRGVHYEAAFEDYLRSRQIPYVPVDEARRVIFAGARVKSFDMLVYPEGARPWIVDIKGRQFPYVNRTGAKRYWESWVAEEDVQSLAEWQSVFGEEFEAQFVFAYVLQGPPDHWPPGVPHRFRDEQYAFFAVTLKDYRAHCRRRSSKWNTVSVPAEAFRRISRLLELRGSHQDSASPA